VYSVVLGRCLVKETTRLSFETSLSYFFLVPSNNEWLVFQKVLKTESADTNVNICYKFNARDDRKLIPFEWPTLSQYAALHVMKQGSAPCGLRDGSGLPSKIIRPAALYKLQ